MDPKRRRTDGELDLSRKQPHREVTKNFFGAGSRM